MKDIFKWFSIGLMILMSFIFLFLGAGILISSDAEGAAYLWWALASFAVGVACLGAGLAFLLFQGVEGGLTEPE